MKILISGALGHIGSQLIRQLPYLIPNCEILMVDSLITQRYCSLFNLPSNINYRFFEEDIRKIDLNRLLEGVHVVVHLAAITDAAGSFDNAVQVEENNFNSTKIVAEACLAKGVRLITLSSTSVYGTQAGEVDEDCSEEELQPQSPYAITKLNEERFVQQLVKNAGLKAAICRFGTIFGASPGMRFHTAVNKFCWQAAMEQPITVWRTAYEQKRPYLELNDACKAIAHIILNELFDGSIFNVLTLNATVREVVETIQKVIPTIVVQFVDSQIMNQLSYQVSNDRFASTGFRTIGNLSIAIQEEIKWIHVNK
jgi:UDP-glucose 4-epimerase